ncbi:TIGR01457 family HAD-type hydrolase [Sediminibacillus dalangtanensis]|uniref:Acid sugar phosphatase n=1 Tax=Sediminibacillus dalangtanensis TaxID=2729421 RepID=A0ABX7VU43_9BACI|nr:TIGR01457 family HAD-type hydrolase [Sediminibacillus dalangtanensis]QTN00202.1 TIGR01457 family HAD-type hydrolase [Sediminibacillus dalangtanensis]
MKNYQAYLVDLDGTMYKGKECIEDAPDFIEKLKKKTLPHLFLTNNSSLTQQQIADKLNGMGIAAEEREVFTSSMATAAYIRQENPEATVFAIGEEGLMVALEQEGFTLSDENADYVVIGIDRHINYEKLAKACLNVRNGAQFISTNGDIAIPTERGLVPGNGAITAVVSTSTGKLPLVIGKPESGIMDQALKELGASRDETLMVGDNYDTDILAGMNAGLDTLMVFTGLTTEEQLKDYAEQPTYTVHTLKDWMDKL